MLLMMFTQGFNLNLSLLLGCMLLQCVADIFMNQYFIDVDIQGAVTAGSFSLAGSNLCHLIIAVTYVKTSEDTTALLDSQVLTNNRFSLEAVDRVNSRISIVCWVASSIAIGLAALNFYGY